ncbi:LysR family transcriptional regulator [Isobaculum melis]|uniref:DNA-binding transcriptional regulator, LysR family n=1 Tax=Isobaculum melis TaxID=142588 RepID=A0A1H9U6M4_9LACT|nr:LysR family transcriptional regulator [Isobaculum melis]SES04999.1 DNA-binding transcriptional regulator, LysR family [Isobaculum melis]
MNLKQLNYFKVLAETEHMTQAAEILSITQPSLSHSMAELEKELGTFLFEKQGRNIRLTKYGRFFLNYVERSLKELEMGEQALKELTSPDEGHIDFAFIYTVGPHLAPLLLKEFKANKQHEKISFSLSQGNTKNIVKELKEEKIDIAICSMIVPDDAIQFEPIVEQEIVLLVPLDHPLAKYDEVSLAETAGYPFIAFNQKSGIRPIIDKMLAEVDVTPDIVYEVEEDHTMAGFVAFGYGIAIMPRLVALSHYQVKAINITNPTYERYLYIANLKHHYLSPATRRFRDFLVDYGEKNLKIKKG